MKPFKTTTGRQRTFQSGLVGERRRNGFWIFLCALGLSLTTFVQAEDADRWRPYLRFHSGDVCPLWGVDDLWSFGLGANFSQHTGGELALDFFERDFEYGSLGALGEVSAWNLVPELRLRKPLLNRRLVPYVIAGIGPSFLQFNDRKSGGYGRDIDIEGTTFAVSVGGGIEYFLADNVAFGVEGKYMWINPIEGKVDGRTAKVDLSSPIFTFGLRVFFDENEPRPLITVGQPSAWRFFFGVRVGGSIRTDDAWVRGVHLIPEPSAVGDTLNQTGALSLGADFRNGWGIELAADSLEHGIQVEDIGTVGEYGMGVVIPYLRLRCPLGNGRWQPYLMAGVGAAYGEFNDAKQAGAGLHVNAKGFYPALGVGGGIEYFVARNFSFNFDVRWLYTWDHEIRIGDGVQGKGDFAALQFGLGFRVYLFEGKSRKP